MNTLKSAVCSVAKSFLMEHSKFLPPETSQNIQHWRNIVWKGRCMKIRMLDKKWFNSPVMTLVELCFLLKSEHVQKFYPYLYGHHAFRVFKVRYFQRFESWNCILENKIPWLSISEILDTWKCRSKYWIMLAMKPNIF